MVNHNYFDYLSTPETKQFLHVIDSARDRAIAILFLSTGIFLKELMELKIDDINWETHTLTITGKRPRDILLNDEAYAALTEWQKERPKTPEPYFFLTKKGVVKGLSHRAIDHLLKKYGQEAGIKKPVSAQVLRGGFAVRLFEQGISIKDASEILGISDYNSLKKYKQAAHPNTDPTHKDPAEALEQLDNRSPLTQFTSKLFSKKPVVSEIPSAPNAMSDNPDNTVIFGRETLIDEITCLLKKEQSTLLIGPLGVGKTHLLEHISNTYDRVIFLESPVPFKQMLKEICDEILPHWKEKLGTRTSIQDLMDYIQESPLLSPPLLIVDHLDRLQVAEAEHFVDLMKIFTVLAATNEKNSRLKIVWWKFKELEVPPLEKEDLKLLIVHLTQNLSITDYKMLENKLLSQANGYPLAIVDMINQLKQYSRVHEDAIRYLAHDVGTKYRDWSWCFMIFWTALVMCRFIALGTHSFEGYILAGFGTATFGTLRYLLMRRR